MLMDTLHKVGIGASGLLGAEIAPQVVDVVSTDPADLVQVVVQIVIGIATLLGLLKNKKYKSKISNHGKN